MRVLVCGGRDYSNQRKVFDTLDDLHELVGITCIIHGAAKGADSLGKNWCTDTDGVAEESYPAKWKDFSHPDSVRKTNQYGEYNVKAGPIRNQQMIDEGKPDLVVAFGGGSGTYDMVKRAKDNQVMVLEIDRKKENKDAILAWLKSIWLKK